MQTICSVFLVLLASHLLTVFVFLKDRGQAFASRRLAPGLILYLTACVMALLVGPGRLLSWRFHLVVLSLGIVHLVVDKAGKWLGWDNLEGFLIDQSLHLATILASAALLAPDSAAEVSRALAWARHHDVRLLAVLVIYTAVIFGGGTMMRYTMNPLLENLPESLGQLPNAGLYIGWLERFLVLTALALQSPGTVGLIITAKSVARYPELKSVHFAEYFLIGSLASISLATLGGIALAAVLR